MSTIKKIFITILAALALLSIASPAMAAFPVYTVPQGGTGTSTAPSYGNLVIGGQHGEYEYIATSTLFTVGVNPSRPLVSTTSRTLRVGSGEPYATIQAAVNQIPYMLLHPYRINIDDGTYNEDVIVSSISGVRIQTGGTETVPLIITGNTNDPTKVKIHSLFIDNLNGDYFGFRGFEIEGSNPYDNETSGVSVYGSRNIALSTTTWAGGVRGLTCYNSVCNLEQNVDFGSGVLSDAMWAKHGGLIEMDAAYNPNAVGSVTHVAYTAHTGTVAFNGNNSTLTGGTSLVSQDSLGQTFDAQNHVGYSTAALLSPSGEFAIGSTTSESNSTLLVYRNGSDSNVKIQEDSGAFDSTLDLRTGSDDASASLEGNGHNLLRIAGGTGDSINLLLQASDVPNQLYLSATGNTGIGSSTPGSALAVGSSTNFINLDIYATSTFAKGINIQSGCLAVDGTCISGDGSSLTGTTGQVTYFSGTNTAEGTSSLFIAPSGNVGISTSTPAAPLNVFATGEALRIGNDTASSAYYSASYDVSNHTPRGSFGYDSGSSRAVVQGGVGKGIEFDVGSATFGSGTVAVFDSAGNFGTGTTTPVANFQATTASANATTTAEIGKPGQNKGSCLKLYRTDGSAIYAYVAAGGTTFTLTTTACATIAGF